jgi:hypothetical protein
VKAGSYRAGASLASPVMCTVRHGAVVLVVVLAASVLVVADEQYSEHKSQSGGRIGNEHEPLRASNIDT